MNEFSSLAEGWNTWNVRSVLSHVLMPASFAVSLGIKSYHSGHCLREALIGRDSKSGGSGTAGPKNGEKILPGPHAYDGTFTSLELEWDGVETKIETAVADGDWFAVVTPLNSPQKTPALTIEGAVLWGQPGYARREGNRLVIRNDNRCVTVAVSGTLREEPVTEISCPYLMVPLDNKICVASNPDRLAEANNVVKNKKAQFLASRNRLAETQELYDAMQTCLAWDTIYDPFRDMVISPVSRIWSCNNGGWVLFDWDTYFAAWMAGLENKELAYSNAVAITELATEKGMIPGMTRANGLKTKDRSQPPVGSLTVRALCDMHKGNSAGRAAL